MNKLTINDKVKPQHVRLFDVFVLGPFMLYAAYKMSDNVTKTGLIAAGLGTMWYNWENFQTVRRTNNDITTT